MSILNYVVASYLLEKKSRKVLFLIVFLDLSILGFFKYFYLFASGIGFIFQNEYLINIRENLIKDFQIEIILPIAISFYTFQIIAFVVDCYRGVVQKKIPFSDFLVFILFFPQFVAGPILRASDFIPQIHKPVFSVEKMNAGLLLILSGIVKKVLIADPIGYFTGNVWKNPYSYDGTILWLVIYAFIVQVYADFSGYTDMARGMSKLLGYELPENFRGPLMSKSISELWNRWHITLSSWLRDYLYIPLGGSKRGELRTYFNLIATMTLGGLWHGATWNMLIWGFLMGVYLSLERFLQKSSISLIPQNTFGNLLKWMITFSVFSLLGVFFATPTLDRAIYILKSLWELPAGQPLVSFETVFFLVIAGLFLNYVQYNGTLISFIRERHSLRWFMVLFGSIAVTFLLYHYSDMGGIFLYFNF